MKPLKLSPSSLSLFLECKRCFWLHHNKGIKRPSGPFPSLPGGMDRILKEYFDLCRERGCLPLELGGNIKGELFQDMEKLKIWRNAWKGLQYVDKKTGSILKGALDDLFVTDKGEHIPVDFKTRSSPPKEESIEFVRHQMDIYSFLLQCNGLKTGDFACLLYYYPDEYNAEGLVKFSTDFVKLKTNKKRGKQIFLDALETISGKEPKANQDCAYCKYRGMIK